MTTKSQNSKKRKNKSKVKAGKLGGAVTSKAKRLAAIANGKKGGRPRKNP